MQKTQSFSVFPDSINAIYNLCCAIKFFNMSLKIAKFEIKTKNSKSFYVEIHILQEVIIL